MQTKARWERDEMALIKEAAAAVIKGRSYYVETKRLLDLIPDRTEQAIRLRIHKVVTEIKTMQEPKKQKGSNRW